jgi:hypothetical protein
MVLSQEQWTKVIKAGGTAADVEKIERGEVQIDWEMLDEN